MAEKDIHCGTRKNIQTYMHTWQKNSLAKSAQEQDNTTAKYLDLESSGEKNVPMASCIRNEALKKVACVSQCTRRDTCA